MPEHTRLSPVTDVVVTLTLARPGKKNALSIALREEVTAALGALAADAQVKAVVVTGAGDVFHAACLGFPLPLLAAVRTKAKIIRRAAIAAGTTLDL